MVSRTSNYPEEFDKFDSSDKPNPTDPRDNPSLADLVSRVLDSIEQTQKELGTQPSGDYSTVKDRLSGLYDQITEVQNNLTQKASDVTEKVDDTRNDLNKKIDEKLDKSGGSVSGTLSFGGNVVDNAVFERPRLKYIDDGDVSGSITLDASAASLHKVRVVDDTTIDIGNWPSDVVSVTLVMDRNGAHDIDWNSRIHWSGGNDPAVSQNSGEIDMFEFLSYDGGENVYGFTSGLQMG